MKNNPTKPGPKPIPIQERFWKNVRKDGCWVWQGATQSEGYGVLKIPKTTAYAHRLSWEIHKGPIPHGLLICHHCDNPPCVNPAHLFLGTKKDNAQDMLKKGRDSHGKKHGVLIRVGIRKRHLSSPNQKQGVGLEPSSVTST